MKKLNKLVLHNEAKVMTAPQMKHITGGYGSGYDGECLCIITWINGSTSLGKCYGTREYCENYRGENFGDGVQSIECP